MKLPDVVRLPIEAIQPVDWNPNVEDVATFNELVENIRANGFNEPLIVCPIESDGMYEIISGEHRWKAAKIIGLPEVLAIVRPEWDEDMRKAQNMRMNMLHGRLDAQKFAKLWNGLEAKYGYAGAQKLIGMESKEKELARLLSSVKKSMPEDMQAELEKRADKIRNVEDLAAVVQSLYARFGGTIEHSFMFLTFGGQTHLLIKLSKEALGELKGCLAAMHAREQDANELVLAGLRVAAAASAEKEGIGDGRAEQSNDIAQQADEGEAGVPVGYERRDGVGDSGEADGAGAGGGARPRRGRRPTGASGAGAE